MAKQEKFYFWILGLISLLIVLRTVRNKINKGLQYERDVS